MTDEQINIVCDFWKMHEDEDISTERLLGMCKDYAGLEDIGDVVECLGQGGIFDEEEDELWL